MALKNWISYVDGPYSQFNFLVFTVIGGGITSAATSAFVSERLCSKNIQLTVWEKARGAGGRMSTSRSSGNSKCIADLGAQYISVTPEYEITHK